MTTVFVAADHVDEFDDAVAVGVDAQALATWLHVQHADLGKPDDAGEYDAYGEASGLDDGARFGAALTRALADGLVVSVTDMFGGADDILLSADDETEYERRRTALFPAYDDFLAAVTVWGSGGGNGDESYWPTYAATYSVSTADMGIIIRLARLQGDIVAKPTNSYTSSNEIDLVAAAFSTDYDDDSAVSRAGYAIAAWIQEQYGSTGMPNDVGDWPAHAATLGISTQVFTDGLSYAFAAAGILVRPSAYWGGGTVYVRLGADSTEHTARLALVSSANTFLATVEATGGDGISADPADWHGYAVALSVSDADFARIVDMLEEHGDLVVKTA